MIIQSSHPLSPKVEITLDGVAVNYNSIVGFDMDLHENEHDMLIIEITGIPPKAATDYIGTAVYALLDSGYGRSQTFYGYVISTEPSSVTRRGLVNKSLIQSTKLNCIGASLPMKEISSRVWESPTLGNIVKEIAKKYHFSLDYPKDSFKPTRLVQALESDWAFLRRVVMSFGYAMSVHGTHIHIWDISKSVGRLPSYHQLLTMSNNTENSPCTVLTFDAYLGHLSSAGNSSKSVNTVLDNQGNIFSIDATQTDLASSKTINESKFSMPLKRSYQTLEENKRAVMASEQYKSIYHATAEVVAGAGIVPGGTVDLKGYESNFDGLWYVSGVCHKMAKEKYTTVLSLKKSDDYVKDPTIPLVTSFVKPAIPSYLNTQWVSSMENINEYA
jgi:phage protein D